MNTATLFKRCQALCMVQDGGRHKQKEGGLTAISTPLLSCDDYTPAQSLTGDGFLMTSADLQHSRPSCISLIRGLIAPIRWIVLRHTANARHSSPAIWTHPDVAKKLLKLEPSLSLWTFMSDLTERKWSQKLNSNKIIFQGFCWQTGKWAGYCCVL